MPESPLSFEKPVYWGRLSCRGLVKSNKLEILKAALIFIINDFEKKIELAGPEYSPSILAQYLFDLAKEIQPFYADLPIFPSKTMKLF